MKDSRQALQAKIRKVLQHHKLTVHGDGVVEGDLMAVFDHTCTHQGTGLDPEMGFILEGANAGELAAYDYAVLSHCAATLHILDGKDHGHGSNNEPWASVRKRLVELVKRTSAEPTDDAWPAKPLKQVQVCIDSVSRMAEPERAYFSSWAMQANANALRRSVLLEVIQRLNADTYNLTKAECIAKVQAMRE